MGTLLKQSLRRLVKGIWVFALDVDGTNHNRILIDDRYDDL